MTAQALVGAVALLVSGWVAGAEAASWVLVQPVITRLEPGAQVRMHQGMLRTYGRVMPALMPLATVLLVVATVVAEAGAARALWGVAAAAAVVVIVTTLTVNVPINRATGRWDPDDPPAGWQADRRRWHRFQGLRAGLLTLATVCAALAVAVG